MACLSGPMTLQVKRKKHLNAPHDIHLPDPTDDTLESAIIAIMEDIIKTLKSFRSGSAAGPDGLRPSHIESFFWKNDGGAGVRLDSTFTAIVNPANRGKIHISGRKSFYGASLCTSTEKNYGIRSIAVWHNFFRLASKEADRLDSNSHPVQLGYATKGICEAAALHASLHR